MEDERSRLGRLDGSQANGETCLAVVLTFNRPALLRTCLTALLAQSLQADEILVVDNGSDDATLQMLSRAFPDIECLRIPSNLGSPAGFGAGIEEGRRRGHAWIWIMDDDAEPDPDCLRRLIEAGIRLGPSVILLAPTVVGTDGETQALHRGFYSPVWQRQVPVTDSSRTLGYSSYLGMMLRAEKLGAVPPPRADFFFWFDDIEYSMRLAREGDMYLVPDARMFHHDQTQGRRSWQLPVSEYWKLYYAARNRILLLKAHERGRLRRAIGYGVGLLRTVRTMLSVAIFRPPASLRLIRLLGRGLLDGLGGRTGKVLDPAEWRREEQLRARSGSEDQVQA